jgi:hypothetical protein
VQHNHMHRPSLQTSRLGTILFLPCLWLCRSRSLLLNHLHSCAAPDRSCWTTYTAVPLSIAPAEPLTQLCETLSYSRHVAIKKKPWLRIMIEKVSKACLRDVPIQERGYPSTAWSRKYVTYIMAHLMRYAQNMKPRFLPHVSSSKLCNSVR